MAHLPPPKMFTHKRIREMLEKYRDDTTVFATETEYYLALYAHEMWQRLNCLKTWTERYRLNTDSIEAFMKRELAKPKANRVDWHPFLLLTILVPVLALTLYATYKFYKG